VFRSGIWGALPLAAALLALAPGSAAAATVFGADMTQSPALHTSLYSITTVIDPGGAENTGAPVSGILTSVRLKTNEDAGDGVIQVLTQVSHPDPATYSFLNEGPEIPIAVTADATSGGHITEVLTRRPIALGQKLAVDLNDPLGTVRDAYNDPTAECAFTASNPLGMPTNYSTSLCNHNPPLISGTIEPDFDHDGFGDDTQDQCTTNGAQQGPCPVLPPLHKKKCKKKKHHNALAAAAKKCKKKHH